jgi:AraC-like DNA-binding protein
LHDPVKLGRFEQNALATPTPMVWNYGMEDLKELRGLIARHAAGGFGQELLSGVFLGAASVPSVPIHAVYEPLLVVIAQGSKRIVLADRVFDNNAGEYLVVPLDLPVSSHVTKASKDAPFLSLALTIKPQLVASLLLESAAGDRNSDEALAIGVRRAPAELLDAVVRLLRLLDRPADIPILQPMIEREIVWRLLGSDQGGLVRQIGLADSRLSKIGHAARWIREHYAETVRIEDLADRVAMSPTSFHRHFRSATAMSPLQYQKQIRLQEARSRLIARAGDVAGIGLSVGYDSPSQFSREYARLFGAPPSRDTAVLRGSFEVLGDRRF